jgi:Transposase IS4
MIMKTKYSVILDVIRTVTVDGSQKPCGGCSRPAGGVHKCPLCDKHMHPFCGRGIGAEGYGQEVICPACDQEEEMKVNKQEQNSIVDTHRQDIDDIDSEDDFDAQSNYSESGDENTPYVNTVFESDEEGDPVKKAYVDQCRSEEEAELIINEADEDEMSHDSNVIEQILSGGITIKDKDTRRTVNNMEWEPDVHTADAPNITNARQGMTPALEQCLSSPLTLFLFFIPVTFWKTVADETNKYEKQTKQARVDRLRQSYPRSKNSLPFKSVTVIDLLRWVGLLIFRCLAPFHNVSEHWKESRKPSSLIPQGTFNSVMSRNRFDKICEFIHFTDNLDPKGKGDRCWKIRLVLDTISKTFKAGYRPGKYVSFDEGIIPNISKYSPI